MGRGHQTSRVRPKIRVETGIHLGSQFTGAAAYLVGQNARLDFGTLKNGLITSAVGNAGLTEDV